MTAREGFFPPRARPADDPIRKKVLVAYATRNGSTAEVAQAIARRLREAGPAADARPVGEVAALDGYDAAVLGSAVRYAGWLPEMIAFLQSNRQALSERPLAFFTMHMLALGDDPAAAAERKTYAAKARALVAPEEEAFFEGVIDPSRLSFLDRLAVRLVKSPVGDRRDWPRIERWGDALARRLMT